MAGDRRWPDSRVIKDISPSYDWRPTMTAMNQAPPRRLPTATIVAVGIIGFAVIFTFVIAGITLSALAIAFPIALPFAERFELYVSPSDLAIAKQFADLWWVFAVAGALSFAAAIASLVATVKAMSPASAR
jgi:hypothetical protein